MAAEESPAFKFYVKEWRSSRPVMRMSFAERGMYLEMLLEQWETLSLPDSPQDVAMVIGGSEAEWVAAWPILRRNFVTDAAGRLVNLRLEKERVRQRQWRDRAALGGHRRASDDRDTKGRFVQQDVQQGSPAGHPAGHPAGGPAGHPAGESSYPYQQGSPASSTSIAIAIPIAIPIAVAGASAPPAARSKRPMFTGQKLTVFEWQVDDCLRTLGALAKDFDLHEWFFALDAQAVRANLVIPKRDGGAWLQAQLVAEAQRRGLPLQMATTEPTNKRIAGLVAGGQAFLNREQRR